MTKFTPLFLPEEHIVLADWLNVDPIERPGEETNVEEALERLGYDREVYQYSQTDAAVASIVLERIHNSLPQWAAVRYADDPDTETEILLGREPNNPDIDRTVQLVPRHLLTINWADSGPGFSWPVAYFATYIPLYDVHIVTESADSPDMFNVCDIAIGHFKVGEEITEASLEIIKADWTYQKGEWSQEPWVYLFDQGLVSTKQANEAREYVWKEETEEDFDEAI
jgi:hypothetical protein